MNKNLIWAITTFLIVAMVCGTVLWINHNSWTLRFEMDDNTKEAIESIDYDKIVSDEHSLNLWIAPSENWTMVTQVNEKIFVNGGKVGYFQEPFEVGVWNRTNIDKVEFRGIVFNATVNEDINCTIEKIICEDRDDCFNGNVKILRKCVKGRNHDE